jgi:hypothetical protein
MASANSTPYPRALSAAPGSPLAALDPYALTELYGPLLVLVGRFPEGLLYTIAPVEIVDFGVCGNCLVVASLDELLSHGTFAEDGDAEALASLGEIVVCAPPLSGAHAFILADLAWREARILETTVAGLESLVVVSSWTPDRAMSASTELFARFAQESSRWWAAVTDIAVVHPRACWKVYTGENETQFSNNLTHSIQKYARAASTLAHRPLPRMNRRKVAGLLEVAAIAAAQGDPEITRRAHVSLLAHPETILGARLPATYEETWVHGIEAEAAAALDRLYREELLGVAAYNGDDSKVEETISLCSKFVFPLSAAYNFAAHVLGKPCVLHPPAAAVANLDDYLGGYLGALDLSRSYITGSAAMSSALRPEVYGIYANHKDFLSSHYSATYTTVADDKIHPLRSRIHNHTWVIGTPPPFTFEDAEPEAEPEAGAPSRTFRAMRWRAEPGQPNSEFTVNFEVVAGADVDIAIDAEGDEFDSIALGHFDAIKACFPLAVLVRVVREKSHMFRVVSAGAHGAEQHFREVEMYPASWAEICTHHVGMVRLAFTAALPDASGALPADPCPEFHLAASCLKAAVARASPNYYYFASRKTTPQEIMLKYAARGYPPTCLPRGLLLAVLKYARDSRRWNPSRDYWYQNFTAFASSPPAWACVGNFNLGNLMVEIKSHAFEDRAADASAAAEAAAGGISTTESDSESD